MKRWVLLLVCIGAVAIIGGTPTRAEKGCLDAEVLRSSPPVSPSPSMERGSREPRVGRDSGATQTTEVTLPSEGCIIVDAAPRMPCCVPDVRGFHPYPECEIVGMPFAGVKMCE